MLVQGIHLQFHTRADFSFFVVRKSSRDGCIAFFHIVSNLDTPIPLVKARISTHHEDSTSLWPPGSTPSPPRCLHIYPTIFPQEEIIYCLTPHLSLATDDGVGGFRFLVFLPYTYITLEGCDPTSLIHPSSPATIPHFLHYFPISLLFRTYASKTANARPLEMASFARWIATWTSSAPWHPRR